MSTRCYNKMGLAHVRYGGVHLSYLRCFLYFKSSVATIVNIKLKMRSSCEIEYFVETHLRKLCVILRSRVLRVVCFH